MNKQITTGVEAREKLMNGINKLADAVTCTLGPSGRNVIYEENGDIRSTKDGVSVAKHITGFVDPIEDLGAKLIKQASIKTSDKAGDGTTTSTLLAQKIVNNGLKSLNNGENAVQIKRDIDIAIKDITNYLRKELKEDISSEDQLKQVATISANNDPEVGELIATAIQKVGREGVVHIEESKTGETYLESVEGMQFNRGYKSHFFVTDNNTMNCLLDNPLILIVDKKLNSVKELLPILQGVSEQNKPLLIIAEDIDGEALSTLIVNKVRGTIKVCAVKAPDFGDRRKLILEDIAILTGGQVFSPEKGMKFEKFEDSWFGNARSVNVDKDQTTIIDGKGGEEEIKKRIEELQSQIEKQIIPYEKEKLQERLAKFVGGIGIIHVGGNTETEMKEKKDRVDDALNAVKAAIEEGIIPGGGVALLRARNSITNQNTTGGKIIYRACIEPFIKIMENAGFDAAESINMMGKIIDRKNIWDGFNIKSNKIEDLKKIGVIDPAKVLRIALENASSISSTILLTESVITNIKEENKETQTPDYSQFM